MKNVKARGMRHCTVVWQAVPVSGACIVACFAYALEYGAADFTLPSVQVPANFKPMSTACDLVFR